MNAPPEQAEAVRLALLRAARRRLEEHLDAEAAAPGEGSGGSAAAELRRLLERFDRGS